VEAPDVSDPLSGGGNGQTPVHADDLVGLRLRWIRTQGQLDEAERLNLLAGRQWAFSRSRSVNAILDDRFVWNLHRRSFGDVWEWAGTARQRGTTIGVDPLQIPENLHDALLDADVQITNAQNGDEIDSAIARMHHRLTVIHPFANGNGRTARLLTDVLIRALDRPAPTWGAPATTARTDYLEALRIADAGDVRALQAFIWS
jgi:Fic-DOC domain mobile mystery protein B